MKSEISALAHILGQHHATTDDSSFAPLSSSEAPFRSVGSPCTLKYSTDNMSGEEVNEYEALRLSKIARNEARLRELGLHKSPWNETKIRQPPRDGPIAAGRPIPTAPLRRSKRTRGSGSSDDVATRETKSRRNPQRGHENTPNDQDYHPPEDNEKSDTESTKTRTKNSNKSRKTPPKPTSSASLPPNSARVMTLNVDKLLTSSLIGKTLSQTGKAHVMEESARLAVDGYGGASISFNKYSGVQEWGNNVLFLWINLDAPNSEVTNDFPNGGRQVTWYGGSRMHEGTQVIQRLLSVGKNTPTGGGGGVVLWCRRYLKERKSFEPYTCLGRLSYISHEPESHPLPFVWKLEDFDRITAHESKERRETFEAMVMRGV